MGMVVRTNTMALNAYRQLGMNNSAVSKSLEKLSSGFRINRAGDDAAGLAISEKMKAQITGLETASANAQDGISLIQTAEGNLNEVHAMLNRMVELATKSANGTYTSTERSALQDEVDQLLEEIDRISQSANFNGTKLLDGTMGLNTDAITVGDVIGATLGNKINLSIPAQATSAAGAKTPTNALPGNFPPEAPEGTTPTYADWSYHLTKESTGAVMPEFTIDLAGITAKGAAANDTISIKVGDKEIELKATAAAADVGKLTQATTKNGKDSIGIEVGKEYTAEELVTLIKDAYTGAADAGTDALGLNNFFYKASGSGTKLTFTAVGYSTDGTVANYAKGDGFNATVAAEANGPSGGGDGKGMVTVTTTATGVVTGSLNSHNMMDVKNPVIKGDGGRAGIDFKLDTTVMADGNRLTIDGKTFVFKTTSTSDVKAGEGEILIDVSGQTGDAAKIAEAVDQMSNYQTDNFKIQANGNGKIHIEQLESSTKTYDTYKSLTGVFSAREKDTGMATKVTLEPSKLKDGDKLVIDGTTYTFVTKSTGAKNEVEIANAAQSLEDALAANNVKATNDGANVVIYGTVDKAPAVTGAGLTLQIGDTSDDFNKMNVQVANMSARGLGIEGISIMTENDASNAIDKVKTAINSVSTARAGMGALQNRLEHTINNLDVAVENLSAANSRIRDTDMAKEMMNYTKMNVLVQSAQAMLAQANQQPQSVLQLLQ